MSKFDPHDSSYDYSATSSSYGIATATAVPVNAYGYPSVPDVSPSAPVYSWNTAENNSMQQDSSKYRTGFSINEAGTRQYLSEMRWPEGLQDAIIKSLKEVPIRYFICDDSGSMAETDGNILVWSNTSKSFSMLKSTRWAELTQSLKFHAALVQASGTQGEFRLLNGASPVMLAPDRPEKLDIVNSLLEASPGGGTPLCRHIREVIASIQENEAILRANGQKACVIIATDGESSDGDIAEAMRPLERLPCWVVVRLCTSDDRIVSYWNNIDNKLEVQMDVLDDFRSEAQEVKSNHNDWLTYGEPLHRMREFGVLCKDLDLLDERALLGSQIRQIAYLIFGGNLDSYPRPEADQNSFMEFLREKQCNAPLAYDSLSRKLEPWFKLDKLNSRLNPKDGCSVM